MGFGNNKKKGDDFENRVGDAVRGHIWKEVLLQPLDSKGEPVQKQDGSSLRVRMDIVRFGNDGNLRLLECKSSQSASLTKNQKEGFPEMEANGFEIVSDQDFLPRGYRQGPTKVEVIRPDNDSWQTNPHAHVRPLSQDVIERWKYAVCVAWTIVEAKHPEFFKEVVSRGILPGMNFALDKHVVFWTQVAHPKFRENLCDQGRDPFHPSQVSKILNQPKSCL